MNNQQLTIMKSKRTVFEKWHPFEPGVEEIEWLGE